MKSQMPWYGFSEGDSSLRGHFLSFGLFLEGNTETNHKFTRAFKPTTLKYSEDCKFDYIFLVS